MVVAVVVAVVAVVAVVVVVVAVVAVPPAGATGWINILTDKNVSIVHGLF